MGIFNKENKVYSIIRTFAKPYKVAFLNLYLCLSFETVIRTIIPVFISILIDEVVYYKNISFFWIIVMCYGFCLVSSVILYFIHPIIWQYLMTKYAFDIRQVMYDNILNAPGEYLVNMQTGDLIARIDNDVYECMHIIQRNIFHFINYIISLIIIFIVVSFYSIPVVIVMSILIPIYIYLTKKLEKEAKTQSVESRKLYGNYISWMYEMLKGRREIKLLSAESNVLNVFRKKYQGIININIKTSNSEFKVSEVLEGISILGTIIIYCVLAISVYQQKLTVGAVVAILTYYSSATQCVNAISNNSMQKAWRSACVERVYDIINMKIEQDGNHLNKLKVKKGEIIFSDIHFAYDNAREIFKGMNLKIEPGNSVCIVGESGIGKTTLMSLLLKIYQPQKGKILIDNIDINTCTYESIRKNIGIVFQEVLIFEGTIRFNLQLAKKDATDEEILQVLNYVDLLETIQNLPLGLDTMLSNRGNELSGGQCQRLAIARIYLKNPPIIIFDEATSALDGENEQRINKVLNNLRKDRTIITISHRISTVLASDKVIVLSDGKVVGYDKHDELMKSNENYRKLFESQYQLQEKGEGSGKRNYKNC